MFPWQPLLSGATKVVSVPTADQAGDRVLLPGAFDPLHEGHRAMARVAAERSGCQVDFELSIENVDKPRLDDEQLQRRVAQFEAHERLWLTRAATFLEKADLFPRATFVVGADTILRIASPRYYANPEAMEQAWQRYADHGCRFMVFGRQVDGLFRTAEDLSLPKTLRHMCESISGSDFRYDVSSTQLREGNR